MRSATRMMLMGSARNGQAKEKSPNYDERSGMEQPRYNEDWVGNKVREQRRSHEGSDPMSRREEGRYSRGEMSGGYGHDHSKEHHRKPEYDEDDEEERGKPQRVYAAGMAWSEQDKGKKHEPKEVDEECAMKWVKAMQGPDGTQMPRFKPDLADQMRQAYCPECKKWEWFVAINMMYADYSEVAKKLGVDRDEYYAHMAKAFLMDEDAGPHKLAKYMEEIPKK